MLPMRPDSAQRRVEAYVHALSAAFAVQFIESNGETSALCTS
jgi:hypothetical protein